MRGHSIEMDVDPSSWIVRKRMTNRQIAAKLSISERTAERHLENVRVKLGVTSRAQIAAWTVEHGPLLPTAALITTHRTRRRWVPEPGSWRLLRMCCPPRTARVRPSGQQPGL